MGSRLWRTAFRSDSPSPVVPMSTCRECFARISLRERLSKISRFRGTPMVPVASNYPAPYPGPISVPSLIQLLSPQASPDGISKLGLDSFGTKGVQAQFGYSVRTGLG